MECWHCKSELIWGGDHDYEAYGKEGEERTPHVVKFVKEWEGGVKKDADIPF